MEKGKSERVRTPFILVNFKTYSEATGKKALKLAKTAENVSLETGVCVGLSPQYTDLPTIARAVSLPVFAQHIDPIKAGRFTGHILPESIKESGAAGTLINHSEKPLNLSEIDQAIKRAREVNLVSIVCSTNIAVSVAAAALNPDMLSIEPPELIETGIAVSRAKPEVVKKTAKLVRRTNPNITILCGAGITNGKDVAAALRLGTEGIIASSGIVRSKDPYESLLNFAEAIIASNK